MIKEGGGGIDKGRGEGIDKGRAEEELIKERWRRN